MADTLDSLMDSYANRPAGGAQQPVDPLDDAMDGYLASRQAQRTATVSRAVQVKPDAYAEQRRIAKQLEYPVAVVEATPDISRERAQTQAVERAASAHPVLDRKFGDEDFARLAHDDTPSLEKLGRWFSGAGSQLTAKAHAGTLSLLGAGARLADELNPFTTSASDAAVLFKNDPAKLRDFLNNDPATFLSRFASAMEDGSKRAGEGVNDAAKRAYGDLRYATTDVDKAAWASPIKIAGDALQSLPTTLALAVTAYATRGRSMQAYEQAVAAGATPEVARAAAIATASRTAAVTGAATEGAAGYAVQYGQTNAEVMAAELDKSPRYKELLAEGFAPEAARVRLAGETAQQAAQIAGVVDAVVNAVGGKYLGKVIGEGGALTTRTLKGAANEAMTEFVQSMGEQFGENWATKLNIDPEAPLTKGLLESAVAGLIVGGVTGGGFSAVLGTSQTEALQRQQADQGARTLRELFALTAEGKLGTRAPDTLQALVQEMADNSEGAPTQVRFDPRALADALQQSGMDETAIEQAVPGLLARTREALAAGDEVAVPIGEFLGVRGTPLEQTLMDHARVGDNELSATEAKDAEATAAQDLQTRAQAVLEQAAAEGEQRTSAEAVKTKVLDRLNAVGRFTSDVNEAYATLHAAFFATMGARSGMAAEALFDQYNLGVQATGVGGEVLNASDPAERDLIITHNLTADNLMHAKKMGGIAVPSLAITKKDTPLGGFGEITLIGPKELADPKGYAGTKVFGADIYSPRYPQVERDIDQKQVGALTKYLKPWADKLSDRLFGTRELEREGQRELERNAAVMATFLAENGVEPKVVTKDSALTPQRAARLKSFGVTDEHLASTDIFVLLDDATFVKAATADLADNYRMADMVPRAERLEKNEDMQRAAARDLAYQIRDSHDTAPDKYATQRAIEQQIDDTGLRKAYEAHVKAWLDRITKAERIPQGYTNSGNRKYTPHTLENVIKILKKELRGGESFNYGVGSLRAKFTPEFKNLDAVRKAKGRLVSAADFEKINKEVDAEFSKLGEMMGPDLSTDTVVAILEDAPKMGLERSAKDFNVTLSPEAKQAAVDFLNKLRDLPTAYFEAKVLRDVSPAEFRGAVVPDDIDPDTLAYLKTQVSDVRTYTRGDEAARAAAIGGFNDLFFQGPRATFSPSTNIITLLENANLSSFLHESGHFFLEVMSDLAAMPNAPADITSDMNALLAWFGVQDLDAWRSMTLEQKRPYHERFAESWEQYMLEGQAPAAELQPLFSRFSAFMKSVYKSLKDFLAGRSSTPGGRATAGAFEQSAFHGTPHRGIDKFSTDKIGTGEGAQAFGWGLYFASKREIAEHYRTVLAEQQFFVDGQPIDNDNPVHIAAATLQFNGDDKATAIQNLRSEAATSYSDAAQKKVWADAADILERGDELPSVTDTQGQLYEVDIPEDSEMLLWDKPLSEQPAKVREALGSRAEAKQKLLDLRDEVAALSSRMQADGATDADVRRATMPMEREILMQRALVDSLRGDGADIYRRVSTALAPFDENGAPTGERGDKAASEALMAAGIKGIKYLDGTSRSAGDGSFNYVVFSGDDVAIKGQFYQAPDAPRNPLGLTPEVRAVFDRMLASDEQIKATQEARGLVPMFKDAAEAGMAPAEFAAYLERNGKATSDAEHTLEKRSLRDLKWATGARSKALKALQKDAAEKRKTVESEVRAEVEAQPVYRAMRFLRTGRWTDAEGVEQRLDKGFKLNSDALAEIYQGAAPKRQGNPFKTFLGRYGVSKAVARDFAPGAKEQRAAMVPKFGPIFRANGLNLDMLAERAVEEGYLLEPDVQQLEELIHSVMRGERVAPQYDGSFEAQAQAMADRQRSLDEANADDPALSGSNVSEADAMRSLGFSEEEIAAATGGQPSATVDLTKLKGMTAANGMHPDLVADLLGYASGDQLVREVIDAQPLDTVVEGMTDQRMLERFGDISSRQALERAADEAVHNEARGRFLVSELKALMEGAGDPRLKATVDKAVDRAQRERTAAGNDAIRTTSKNALVKAAKLFADNLANARKVRDLTPGQHTRAEARAAKAAMKALAAGDREATIQHKRDQVLQHYAARATLEAQDRASRIVDYLKKFEKPGTRKNLPPEYLDQIDKLLERVELRQRTNRDLDKRAKLSAWITEQHDIGVEPEIPDYLLEDSQLVSYRDMTVSDLGGLYDTVRQIEHLGRLKNKLLTAKDQREFAEIRDSIVEGILVNAGNRKADARTPTTNLGRAWASVKSFGAAHIKVAAWARIMDGGKDGGPVWEYFVRSANERGDFETTRIAQATEGLSRIMEPLLKASKLGGKGAWFPTINRSMNRESLLALALNTGNESNLQRLLGGEGWTLAQLQPVLATITRAEWHAVQDIWDYFETFRPEIGAKERRIFGKEPAWIDAGSPVTEALGIRGGYYPVKYDPAASQRAEEHADAEGTKRQLQGAYGAATTKRSFVKGRVEEVNGRPLLYTLSGVYSGVSDVIHDLAWHEWLIDVNRLLKSKGIDGAMRSTYGPEVVRQFKGWRDDIAEGDAGQQRTLEMALGKLRQSVSVAGLGFNVVSAMMQPLGIMQSIVRVGAPWIARGLWQSMKAPGAAAREVNAKSSFMANRTRTRFRELNELRNRVQGITPAKRMLNENAFRLMTAMQQTVDVPTWLGAYEKAIADGQDEARSVSLADQAVIDAQGGGQTKDLAGIERGGPALKLFTTFYSFMNTAMNLGATSAMTPKSKAKLATDLLLLYTVPAVLGSMLKDALTPGDAGDDNWEDLARKLAAEQISFLLGLFVIGREFGQVANTVTGAGQARDYSGPPGLRAITDAYQFAKQAAQGEFDDSFRKATINLAGDLFGLPSAQLNRSITGTQALIEGKTGNPAAVLTGYQEPR